MPVKVSPGAARNEVTGFKDGELLVKIAAPPEKGKANRELTDFLAGRLGVKKATVTVEQGAASRHKLISVEGLTPEEIVKRLLPLA